MAVEEHKLHVHLNQFKDNKDAYQKEQLERHHQDMMDFERRYQGQFNKSMMRDHVWDL